MIGKRRIGKESTLYRAYEKYSDYLRGPFPSGEFDKILYYAIDMDLFLRKNISVSSKLLFNSLEQINSKKNKTIEIKFGFNIYFSNNLTI